MAYGMQIYNSDNSLAYDSTSPGGVFWRCVELEAGGTTGPVFSVDLGIESQGKTIILYPLFLGDHGFSIIQGNATSNQNGSISWYNVSPTPGTAVARNNTIIMVFAK